MSAVEKLLALAGDGPRTTLLEDPAGDLVLAAVNAVNSLRVLLASDPDGDDDSPERGDAGHGGHSGHATFKALREKGMDAGKASRMCAQADKRARTSALADAAAIALAGLAVPDHDWVAATSVAPGALKPGGVFADPGYRGGRHRFPLGTGEQVRVTLAALEQPGALDGLTADQADLVRSRSRAAAARHGIALASAGDAAVLALLELSTLTAEQRRKPSAHTMGDSEDYPIPDKAHLSAAVARYKQGKYAGHSKEQVAAHIRKHAKRLGEEVDLAAGNGLEEAAGALVLAGRPPQQPGHGGAVLEHAPFSGVHSHNHFQSGSHDHPHQHFGDNDHGAGPAHQAAPGPWRPGGGRRG